MVKSGLSGNHKLENKLINFFFRLMSTDIADPKEGIVVASG